MLAFVPFCCSVKEIGSGQFCQVSGATLCGSAVAVKVLKDEHIGNGLARRDLEAEIRIVRCGPWGPIRGAPNRPRTRKQRMHWPSIDLQLTCPRCTSGQMADLHHPGVLALMGAGETPDRKVPTARHH